MKKLSQEQRTEWERLSQAMERAREAVEPLVDEWNAMAADESPGRATEISQATETAWAAWASAAEDVKAFADTIRNAAQDYFDDRTERWQESDKGEEYGAFIEAWGEVADMDVETLEHAVDEDTFELALPESIDDGPVAGAPMEPGE
jgi:hypothetical protein